MSTDNAPDAGHTFQEKVASGSRQASTSGMNRRVLVKGMAWSAPLITATAAVPAFASSCEEVLGEFEALAKPANLNNPAAAVSAKVPARATRMHFEVVGGSGGFSDPGARGVTFGVGARIEGDMAVTPGQVYSLLAGAGGETFGYGRGGKSLYGNGGNGTVDDRRFNGSGGGGASALTLGGLSVVVAGGGGGTHTNLVPEGPQEARYSATLFKNTTATFGSSSVTAFGGQGNGGWSATGMAGETGPLGWMGQRTDIYADPAASNIRLMSGGGRGGGAGENSPGAGGVPRWVAGPDDFRLEWDRNGKPGSGRNGGNGAVNARPKAVAGGGGGGYSGGGGGASAEAYFWGPPSGYRGYYGIAASGGGGSSYMNGSFLDFTATLDGRPQQSTSYGNMGYVRVTFFSC